MPIPKPNIVRVAQAFKIIALRANRIDDLRIRLQYPSVRPGGTPDMRDMLEAATWAAAFELADTTADPFSLADAIGRVLKTVKRS